MQKAQPLHDSPINITATTPLLQNEANRSGEADVESKLHPVDHGFHAWVYLIVAWIIESLCWGFCFSYGVFQTYYEEQENFSGSSSLPIVGTLCTGIPYLSSPVMYLVVARASHLRKKLLWLGFVVSLLASLGASFSTQTWQLILTQGVLWGIGTTLLYVPIVSMLNDWFVKRKGLAIGILFSGTGAGGLVLPLLFEWLLTQYGYATTLRVWTVALVVLLPPSLFLVRERLPQAPTETHISINKVFFKSKVFYVFSASNLLQSFGYFLPAIFITSYATAMDISRINSTILLSVLNLATVIGQVIIGWASDSVDVHYLLFYSSFIGGMCSIFLWGFAKSLGPLVAYALIYGATAGGYSVLWTRFATKLVDNDAATELTLFGIFSGLRGLGNILSGPISTALVSGLEDRSAYGAGRYEKLILFVGVTLLLSSFGVLGRLAAY